MWYLRLISSLPLVTSKFRYVSSVRTLSYCVDPTLGLSDEQKEIQKTAKDFSKKELYPFMDEWDTKKAGELGFGAIYCNEEYGGAGLGRYEAALAFEQLAGGCTSTAAYMAVHNMVPWMIDRFGNEEQKRKYIPDLASFNKLASYCLTEPGSGDYYIVNGSKAFISGSGVSSVYLVMMRLAEGPQGPKGIFSLLMTPNMPDERKLGWCTQPTRIITFEDVKVPVTNRVGELGQGFTIAMEGLNGGRINIAACSLGAAQMSLDLAISHTKVREAFGKTISQFQWTQFKLAEMAIKLITSRLLLREACFHVENNTPNASSYSAMAKMYITDESFNVVNQAIQMYGGYGMLKDYPLQQYLRDCRVHQIIEGTNEIMRLVVARNLLSNEIYNEM